MSEVTVTIHGRAAYLLRGCGQKSIARIALRSVAKRFTDLRAVAIHGRKAVNKNMLPCSLA